MEGRRALRFLDPFAGSGSVSRLARHLGFAVGTNDLEYYAALIGRCRVVLDPMRLEGAFEGEGGSVLAFAALDAFANGVPPQAAAAILKAGAARTLWMRAFEGALKAEPYISLYFAPRETASADWRSERLFYTTENARYLDRAREAVERRYPFDPLAAPLSDGSDSTEVVSTKSDRDAKVALVDALLYEAATRVNTSGVFKACHRGFGGHGGDALGRITSPMRIAPPVLAFGESAEAGFEDAASFLAKRPADIVYLDPPYNQHQYGSNYHMLTSVARWDKPPVPQDRDSSGFLLDRSGIRRDWVETRSDFCRRGLAVPAFERVLDAVDARFVVLSYNDGGIISLDEARSLMEARGQVRVEAIPYIAYRGGKQSARRTERTSELLFVLDRSGTGHASSRSRSDLRLLSARGKIASCLRGRFDAARLDAVWDDRLSAGRLSESELGAGAQAELFGPIRPSVQVGGRLSLNGIDPEKLSLDALETLAEVLEEGACRTNAETFDLVLAEFETLQDFRTLKACLKDALRLLGKLAFRKYADEYRLRSGRLRAALGRIGGDQGDTTLRYLVVLDELDERARLRGVDRQCYED